jgi:hypothetical protein
VITLAGGYARRVEDTVAIHCATIEEAAWPRSPSAIGQLSFRSSLEPLSGPVRVLGAYTVDQRQRVGSLQIHDLAAFEHRARSAIVTVRVVMSSSSSGLCGESAGGDCRSDARKKISASSQNPGAGYSSHKTLQLVEGRTRISPRTRGGGIGRRLAVVQPPPRKTPTSRDPAAPGYWPDDPPAAVVLDRVSTRPDAACRNDLDIVLLTVRGSAACRSRRETPALCRAIAITDHREASGRFLAQLVEHLLQVSGIALTNSILRQSSGC